MKRLGIIGYAIACVLEIGLLASAWAVNYFTKKKMGMVRFVNYHTLKMEKAYPMEQIVLAAAVFLVLLAVAAVFLYGKRPLKPAGLPMVLVTVFLTIGVILFAFLCNKAVTRAYYFMLALLSLAAVIQSVKTVVCILRAPK